MSVRATRSEGSGRVDQCTPPEVLEAVRATFGGRIALDPCSNVFSIVDAEVSIFLEDLPISTIPGDTTPIICDGLSIPWGPRTFVNPPYGRAHNAAWAAKCAAEGQTNELIALVPATPGAKWFRPYWRGVVCFPRRLTFLNVAPNPKTGKIDGADFDNAIVYFPGTTGDVDRFVAAFRHLGPITGEIS